MQFKSQYESPIWLEITQEGLQRFRLQGVGEDTDNPNKKRDIILKWLINCIWIRYNLNFL